MTSEKSEVSTKEEPFVFTEEEKARALKERELAGSMKDVKTAFQMFLDHCVKHTDWIAYTDKKGKRKDAGSIDVLDPSLLSEIAMKANPRGYMFNGSLVRLLPGGNFGKSVKVESL